MKKIFLLFLIIFVSYILLILNYPKLGNEIGKITGLNQFNENVLKFKKTYDKTITNIPSEKELKEFYQKTLSGIIDLINKTKNTIDNVRDTLSGAEKTAKDIKETYNEVNNFIGKTGEKIDKTINTINELKAKTNSGITQ